MIDVAAYAAGVRAGDRVWLARAITLAESTRPDHRAAAQRLLADLHEDRAGTVRIGISGVPGAGKSTFIEALGLRLTAAGRRVATLAIDPSSTRTGGSLLGDTTRMPRLTAEPAAFVRASPSSGTLGGVARATRAAIALVEAAHYDVVLVETVGVGQSELAVTDLVDALLLLTLAGAGDQLQGIKRGVLEVADVVAVNKADGPNEAACLRAARELAGALRLLHATTGSPAPPVLVCSAREQTGIEQVWDGLTGRAGTPAQRRDRRRRQQVTAMWTAVRDRLLDDLHGDPGIRELTPDLERRVLDGVLSADDAAAEVLRAVRGDRRLRPL